MKLQLEQDRNSDQDDDSGPPWGSSLDLITYSIEQSIRYNHSETLSPSGDSQLVVGKRYIRARIGGQSYQSYVEMTGHERVKLEDAMTSAMSRLALELTGFNYQNSCAVLNHAPVFAEPTKSSAIMIGRRDEDNSVINVESVGIERAMQRKILLAGAATLLWNLESLTSGR